MHSKLRLDLEQLAVDSFHTSESGDKKGTVFGEQCTCYTNCTCPGCPTCDATCDNTCGQDTCAASCNGTCGDTCNCEEPATCLQTACGPYFCCA